MASTSAARAAFQYRDFRLFVLVRLLTTLAMQMQSVAIGWQVYAITERPIDLGFVGLSLFLPGFGLSLVAGDVADRLDRRRILTVCIAAQALCSALLWLLSNRAAGASMLPVYAVLVLFGVARAFLGPAGQSVLPRLVAPEHFENAVAWNSSVWQIATILGPAAGGLLYATGAKTVYALCFGFFAIAAVLVAALRTSLTPVVKDHSSTWKRLWAGVHFVWNKPLILGAISLDLFAVLFGGATALLPVYAKDVLHISSWGLGILRSAPAAGAAMMAAFLAYHPLRRRAGRTMFVCVGVFGLATIVFGASRSFWLSLAALLVLGGADMVSVVVRQTLIQMATPDEMRGRVSAVNLVFIGASNDLGEFESGLTAAWLGAVPAVVLGGIGTLIVVSLWAWRFPSIRRVDRLRDVAEPAK